LPFSAKGSEFRTVVWLRKPDLSYEAFGFKVYLIRIYLFNI